MVRVAAGALGLQGAQGPNQAIGFVRAFWVIWIGMGDEGHQGKASSSWATWAGGALLRRAFTQQGKADETRQKQRGE